MTNKEEILNRIKNNDFKDINISIKVPSYGNIDGEIFVANDLKESLEKLGFNVYVLKIDEFKSNPNEDIVIFIRGVRKYYEIDTSKINILWGLYYMKTNIKLSEFKKFDLVFISSENIIENLKNDINVPMGCLLQATNPNRFYYKYNEEYANDILFVGNTRGEFRPAIRDILKTKYDVSLYGRKWKQFLGKDTSILKGDSIDNNILNEYYSSCKILLNDQHKTMADNGIISNRIFDASACGTFVITKEIKDIEKVFGDNVVTYTDYIDLENKITYYLENEDERIKKANNAKKIVLKNHTFDYRVKTIIDGLKKIDNFLYKGAKNMKNDKEIDNTDNINKMKYLCKKCDECKHYKYKGTYNKKDFSFWYCNGNKELVEKYDWRPHEKGKNTYIRLTSKYNTKVKGTDKLHGMFAEKGLEVDHINRNSRDNRLCNLRLVLPLMNQMNKGTEYHNVVKRANGRYVGHVTVNGKTYYTKQCKTPKEAMYEVERLQKTQMKLSRRTVIKL